MIRIIRSDGEEEEYPSLDGDIFEKIEAIKRLIGSNLVDSVPLKNGMLMVVDPEGWQTGRRINQKATLMYHEVTMPTEHQIAGDVAIVHEKEFHE